MTYFVGVLLTLVALLLLVPSIVFFLETTFARRAASFVPNAEGAARPRTAVLVPAHDEAAGIAASLATIVPQLAPGDRLVVVADNCSDDTARVAAAAGAEAIRRDDPERRGKGYALDFGVRHLAADAPGVVVIVDADCVLHPGSLGRIATTCVASGRPVQALYLMRSPPGAPLSTRISEFAWAVRNLVRPLGALRLGATIGGNLHVHLGQTNVAGRFVFQAREQTAQQSETRWHHAGGIAGMHAFAEHADAQIAAGQPAQRGRAP